MTAIFTAFVGAIFAWVWVFTGWPPALALGTFLLGFAIARLIYEEDEEDEIARLRRDDPRSMETAVPPGRGSTFNEGTQT